MKYENEEGNKRNIKNMIQDDYKSPWKIKDATVATGFKTVTYSSDLDENPAARKELITDTQTLKEPIKGSHRGKIVCHSELLFLMTILYSITPPAQVFCFQFSSLTIIYFILGVSSGSLTFLVPMSSN